MVNTIFDIPYMIPNEHYSSIGDINVGIIIDSKRKWLILQLILQLILLYYNNLITLIY